ncbi:MAG: DUF1015 domain-containing protein [Clostridia bacterium]|nr:DUF1015 domain-containing protein [Clostridia bacterium]
MRAFGLAKEILIPEKVEMEKWAVIACDQFTSQPEYWNEVKEIVGNCPSTLSLIYPEVWLGENREQRIRNIHRNMRELLDKGLFSGFDGYVYVERTLRDGSVRQGIVGCIDLETYDYHPSSKAAVRATEKTVTERIPPRMEIRRGAMLELSHVLLLCSDEKRQVIEQLGELKKNPPLYDFDLMQGGGHLTGWRCTGPAAERFEEALNEYENRMIEKQGNADSALLYAVGDGNHSLATAKECYEEEKARNPERDPKTLLSRYAMVELENVYSDALQFEPIHRIVKGTDPATLLKALEPLCAEDGIKVRWIAGAESGTLNLSCQGKLPVAVLQDALDRFLEDHPGEMDYIHGEESLAKLAAADRTVGFLLPGMDKGELFPGIINGGVLPRKTFSMGHAEEKRYYLEARQIRQE